MGHRSLQRPTPTTPGGAPPGAGTPTSPSKVVAMGSRHEHPATHDYLDANNYQSVDDWLDGIRQRRAAAPTKTEIQAAITAALEAGMNLSDIARATGIPRQQFYQGKYDLTANTRSLKSAPDTGASTSEQRPKRAST